MNKFWIVISLSAAHTQVLRHERFHSLAAASAEAQKRALQKPVPEGYAILECVKVTGSPTVSVQVNDPSDPLSASEVEPATPPVIQREAQRARVEPKVAPVLPPPQIPPTTTPAPVAPVQVDFSVTLDPEASKPIFHLPGGKTTRDPEEAKAAFAASASPSS